MGTRQPPHKPSGPCPARRGQIFDAVRHQLVAVLCAVLHLASLLIASGAHIKTVQARLRHASARTTLDTYGHLWPDADESTRAAVGAVIKQRMADHAKTAADALRTDGPA